MSYKNRTCNLFADFFSEVYTVSENEDVNSEIFQYLNRCTKVIDMPALSINESTLLDALK